jgi:uncharacterized membrane protein YdjX (TVP38/TMEM64 family)
VMIGAVSLHISRGEVSSAITTSILFVLVTFVAYMRWRVLPILPRTPVANQGGVGTDRRA